MSKETRAATHRLRTDEDMMRGYGQLAKDLLIDYGMDKQEAKDWYKAANTEVKDWKRAGKANVLEYQSPSEYYGYLIDNLPTQYADQLKQAFNTVDATYKDYNLPDYFSMDGKAGSNTTTGFNPRKVGYHTLNWDEKDNKYPRIDKFFDTVKPGSFAASDLGPLSAVGGTDNVYSRQILKNGGDYLKAFYTKDPNSDQYTYAGADNYVHTSPKSDGGFLGGGLGTILSLAAAISGNPYLIMANAGVQAASGNPLGAVLSMTGIPGVEVGGEWLANPLNELNPMSYFEGGGQFVGPMDPSGGLNWTKMAAGAGMNAATAGATGKDPLLSAVGAFGPVTGLPGPLGSMALQYGINALKDEPSNPTKIVKNVTPVPGNSVLPWNLPKGGGTGLPAAPATPKYV